MYQSQARRRVVSRILFAQQQPNQHQSSSVFQLDATDSKSVFLQSLSSTLGRGGKVALAAAASILIPVLSGCGVNYNNADPNAEHSRNGAVLSQISCGTQSLTGAQSKTCSVDLNSAARGQTVIKLTSSNAALKVPSDVTVSKGAKSAAFKAVASSVEAAVTVTITGTSRGVSKADVITLYPATAASTTAVKLSKVSCGTSSLTGPTTKPCSVYLTAAAPSATAVTLSSTSAALQVPSAVTIAQGATTTGFNVTASAVTNSQSVTLTASSGGVSQTFAIQLVGSSGQTTAQHTVQLNWVAPGQSTASLAGYRIYRSNAGTSSYIALNSSVDKQTSYLDSTVESGQSYEYVVTSVSGSGMESDYSDPTTVTIP